MKLVLLRAFSWFEFRDLNKKIKKKFKIIIMNITNRKVKLWYYSILDGYKEIRDFFNLTDIDAMIWLVFIVRYLIRNFQNENSK
jgi:hypothetical protein